MKTKKINISSLIIRLAMLTQERNIQRKRFKVRVLILILSILLSKNVKIEIVRPNLTLRISIESIYTQSVNKLLEWF
jgi:hypothetical protein